MNTYKKYCPNVFVAQCEEKYEKGDVIQVQTKYGKENECLVHNFVGYTGTKENPMYCYSITRLDGFDAQARAKAKADRISGYAANAEKKSDSYYEASNEGRDFLALGEPIKVGHHSEKRHRALIERNHNRMGKSIEFADKAKEYENRAEYWEKKSNEVNLSMPESVEFFTYKLEKATEYHEGLKSGKYERSHSFSLTYAKKDRNEAEKNLEIAKKLWS